MKTLTMFRRLGAAAIMALLIAWAAPAEAQQYRYWWQVMNENGVAYPRATVLCSVYRSGSVSDESGHVFTTMNDPTTGTGSPLVGTVVGNVFEFFWPDTTSVWDVVCWARNGQMARVNKLDRNTHRIIIARSGTQRVSRFAFHTSGNTGQVATDVSIPQGAVIRDVLVQQTAWGRGASTAHIIVGFAGNHIQNSLRALCDVCALNSHGVSFYRPHLVVTGGSAVGITSFAVHRGTALVLTHGATGGLYFEIPYVVHVAGGVDVVYMARDDYQQARGHFYIIWDEYHVGVNRYGISE